MSLPAAANKARRMLVAVAVWRLQTMWTGVCCLDCWKIILLTYVNLKINNYKQNDYKLINKFTSFWNYVYSATRTKNPQWHNENFNKISHQVGLPHSNKRLVVNTVYNSLFLLIKLKKSRHRAKVAHSHLKSTTNGCQINEIQKSDFSNTIIYGYFNIVADWAQESHWSFKQSVFTTTEPIGSKFRTKAT